MKKSINSFNFDFFKVKNFIAFFKKKKIWYNFIKKFNDIKNNKEYTKAVELKLEKFLSEIFLKNSLTIHKKYDIIFI